MDFLTLLSKSLWVSLTTRVIMKLFFLSKAKSTEKSKDNREAYRFFKKEVSEKIDYISDYELERAYSAYNGIELDASEIKFFLKKDDPSYKIKKYYLSRDIWDKDALRADKLMFSKKWPKSKVVFRKKLSAIMYFVFAFSTFFPVFFIPIIGEALILSSLMFILILLPALTFAYDRWIMHRKYSSALILDSLLNKNQNTQIPEE